MAFERFTKGGTRGFQPKVSLRARGYIGFNQGAVNRFKLEQYKYAILYFDNDANSIAIEPTNNEQEEGIMKLRVNKKTKDATISAKTFCDYYDIDYSETQRLIPSYNEEMKAIVVQLPKKEVVDDDDVQF